MKEKTRTDSMEVRRTPTAPLWSVPPEDSAQWDRFEDFVKKIAAVPKEEVDQLRAEREREKKEDL